ncbi:MAG: hypothetical protein WCP93_04170 [Candidatus Berkelbacteria bacterium]
MTYQGNYFEKGITSIPKNHEILQKCYLCGDQSDLDREHVIPKVIFRPNRPTNPIILKSCKRCNNNLKGKNEEYMVRAIQLTSFNEEAQKGFDKAINGFNKGQGLGIRGSLISKMQKGGLKTQEGVLLGTVNLLNINAKRMNDLIINIAKGLLVAHSLKLYDWSKYNVRIRFDQTVQDMFLINDPNFRDIINKSRFSQNWNGNFFYCGDFIEDGNISIWTMIFYNSHIATVSFYKKGRLRFKKESK